jgi:hypothetical protein
MDGAQIPVLAVETENNQVLLDTGIDVKRDFVWFHDVSEVDGAVCAVCPISAFETEDVCTACFSFRD